MNDTALSNLFNLYILDGNPITDAWMRTEKILGDLPELMTYTKNGYAYANYCYAVDCLVGSTSDLGEKIANQLKQWCGKKGNTRILITDLINPYQIPGIAQAFSRTENGDFFSTDKNLFVCEDSRYVCGILNKEKEEEIHMYFYHK